MSPLYALLLCALVVCAGADRDDDRDGRDDWSSGPTARPPGTRPGQGAFRGYNVVSPRVWNTITDIDAREYDLNEMIPEVGVSKECLVILDNWAWQVQMNDYQSLCPRGTFGSVIVDFKDKSGSVKDSLGRSCGRIISTNRGIKTTTDPTEHAENDAIRRLAYHRPNQRTNATLWNPLAVFTPGASCPLDTATEIWTGVAWQVYSLSIADLIALNFTQIAVEPEELMSKVGTITAQRLGLVRYVQRAVNVGRFGYRNILSNPCPTGCHRVTPTSICTDIGPFTAARVIPDMDYLDPKDDFQLLFNPAN